MSALNEEVIRSVTLNTKIPVVFRAFISHWPICRWNLEKWSNKFGQTEYPFRCVNKHKQSHKPCWERRCTIREMTFRKFTESALSSDEAMYFDYKYLHEWFSEDDELCKEIHWERFGFPLKGPRDTTLWVGSDGAHTPAHQDTYGVNIVLQVLGTKRWILFPPQSEGLKPSRVPYEESSVYSNLNFYCPSETQLFKGLTGAHVVVLSAGDALIVPHKWWHYVQNEDPINISLNMWLPHEEDEASRVSEAVIKIFVAQLCKDLTPEQARHIVNPTEDDLADTPLSVLLSQLRAASSQCLEKRLQRRKRQTTDDVSDTNTLRFDFDALIHNPDNKMEVPAVVSGEELVKLIEETKMRYAKGDLSLQDDDDDDDTSCMAKSIVNAFCQKNVVEQFKRNLLDQSRDTE